VTILPAAPPAVEPANSSNLAGDLFASSRPQSRHAHWQKVGDRGQLLVTNGSRLFDVGHEVLAQLDVAAQTGDLAVEEVLIGLGVGAPSFVDDTPLQSPPLHALSLAIAQKCNLGCTYCYASQGDFGGPPKNMSVETARRAVEMLVGKAAPDMRVNLAFLGGEPLANRAVLQSATELAAEMAAARGVRATFSITTNGTLLTEEDAAFFERHGFAVTVSLDGLREAHDLHRPFKNGGGSFDRIMARVQPLLSLQRRMQVSVRATIAPGNLRLRESLDYFLDMGFHSVGFSPLLRSPTGNGEMKARDLAELLEAMVQCGMEFERHTLRGERYAFSNMVNAMRELHRGTHRPYPCGAGAGYLGVSADGDLAACHRFVGEPEGGMGTLAGGINRQAQNGWLTERHVHNQSPCGQCWARYLCSGGCHHEVIARGRPACDFIRGWLHFCLSAYARLSVLRPDWFGGTQSDLQGRTPPHE
jgi:uncharacterized protein